MLSTLYKEGRSKVAILFNELNINFADVIRCFSCQMEAGL